jgi:cyclic pyranopterin monophosphate synthase
VEVTELSFTHLDPMGRARMVDVTPKEATHRRAVARGRVHMQPETIAAIANREVKKGDVLAVARVAGIQASKRTSDMIPLCHPLMISGVSVNFELGDTYIEIECVVDTVDRTGVEMEALHACAVAALTIYDMCKSADKGMVIGDLALWEKQGGKSGTYTRPANIATRVTNVVET